MPGVLVDPAVTGEHRVLGAAQIAQILARICLKARALAERGSPVQPRADTAGIARRASRAANNIEQQPHEQMNGDTDDEQAEREARRCRRC